MTYRPVYPSRPRYHADPQPKWLPEKTWVCPICGTEDSVSECDCCSRTSCSNCFTDDVESVAVEFMHYGWREGPPPLTYWERVSLSKARSMSRDWERTMIFGDRPLKFNRLLKDPS